MKISLTEAGKRFNREWIFRRLNYEFQPGQSYAIVGPNGSGKSTLLQVIAGSMQLNEGTINWNNGKPLSENIFQHVSICAPYLELVEEMTLMEFLEFHHQFKPLLLSITEIITAMSLKDAAQKQMRNFSSGMKQRVKLAQALFSNVPLVLLDEPCTNLDAEGIALYQRLIKEYTANRLVIVSSNDEVEYSFCKEKLNVTAFKS